MYSYSQLCEFYDQVLRSYRVLTAYYAYVQNEKDLFHWHKEHYLNSSEYKELAEFNDKIWRDKREH